jgi:hypothetical protein
MEGAALSICVAAYGGSISLTHAYPPLSRRANLPLRLTARGVWWNEHFLPRPLRLFSETSRMPMLPQNVSLLS